MRVYHASLEGKGFFIKTDRQPSGGGVLTSPYLHDITLNYALFSAFQPRPLALPENPRYLEDFEQFFRVFPVYAYPSLLRGYQKTESINVIPSTRAIPDIGNKDNVPQWNRWLGYRQFSAQTTIIADDDLPLRFYCRLGKKRSITEVHLREAEFKVVEGTFNVGLISPLMHQGLDYQEGTFLRMNPMPLFIGRVKGQCIRYQVEREVVVKPLQFRVHKFEGLP